MNAGEVAVRASFKAWVVESWACVAPTGWMSWRQVVVKWVRQIVNKNNEVWLLCDVVGGWLNVDVSTVTTATLRCQR